MDATEELEAGAARLGAPVVLGRYRLGPRLGSGGFGTVYAGHDERLDRPVAVKVIPGHGPAPERASREAQAVARLDHPGIVAVFDAGEDDHARYLVSELVRGRTLDRLTAKGALSDRDVVRVGLALADALAHAHERGVIHRDVKPQNVIVPDRPTSARAAAKLTDFGVAHLAGHEPLTHTGDVVGTLAYMAPEQAAGSRVDERADLYALALVLYEALAGANPVRAASPAATARRVGTVLPQLGRARRDLPLELCAALDRALRPRSAERGSLEELAGVLLEVLPELSDAGGTIAAHPVERTATPALPPAVSRVAGALAAALLAASGITLLPDPAIEPLVAAAGAAVAVAVLPRAGWLACAGALVVALAGVRPGGALVVAAVAIATPLALWRRPAAWSLPALAAALGLIGLAGAYPTLAGRAGRVGDRLALGALGAWWVLLASPLLSRALVFAPDAPADWELAAGSALEEVLGPLVTSGALALGVLWAAAAAVLPWVVRGRSLPADVVGASAWAAGLAAATQAVGEWAQAGEPRGLVAGAVVAGALAVGLPRARRPATVGS